MAATKIDSYEVMYSANLFAPRIGLKSNGAYFAQLIFLANGSPLPDDKEVGGQIQIHYFLDHYANVIDLLRNEEPLYLLYSGSGGGYENGVRTTTEPIGEGE